MPLTEADAGGVVTPPRKTAPSLTEQDLANTFVQGMPLPVFLVKMRLDLLTNFLLPVGCKDREAFEKDFERELAKVAEGVEASKKRAHLAVAESPSGLIVPGQ